ncbi:helix-turn-helix transcriptional regulator [Solibacillus sp.]|uniref:helix-turn-helix domain-containing protein n=1 Tax=Solibacillus sp. TaxID=1909654 RepID=UPI0033160223
MNLPQLLIQLRGEETPNQAALRIGLSPNYYRDLERGYSLQRKKPLIPSKETLEKIAVAFKVDYNILAKAANLPVKNHVESVPFPDNPNLHQWYKSLPDENLEDVQKLFNMWQLLRGGNQNVL